MTPETPDFTKFQRPDTVTPTKWKGPDLIVWERTGEKRLPEPGDYVWIDSSRPCPYEYRRTAWFGREDRPCERCGFPDRSHNLLDGILYCPAAPTPIWKVSDDQAWTPPAAPVDQGDEFDRMKRELEYTDNYGKLYVAALLLQARELKRAADSLEKLDRSVESIACADSLDRIADALERWQPPRPFAPLPAPWYVRAWRSLMGWFR